MVSNYILHDAPRYDLSKLKLILNDDDDDRDDDDALVLCLCLFQDYSQDCNWAVE